MIQSVSPVEQRVVDALTAAGFVERAGWFYPTGDPDRAAVRLSVYGGQYQIWRRRKLSAPWLLIVTADVEEFDSASFSVWRDSWPLTY